MQLEVKKY